MPLNSFILCRNIGLFFHRMGNLKAAGVCVTFFNVILLLEQQAVAYSWKYVEFKYSYIFTSTLKNSVCVFKMKHECDSVLYQRNSWLLCADTSSH